ncbi:1-Phosphatidylinositol 4,5-Bisphosphate Phosphodiesterase Beta-3 [Manis pentadactyla]|nr:1-Phosphatidylinositol 4,5-Bisphosphate Phosphodiesterase Beta-3 [Manis pentadactyla]
MGSCLDRRTGVNARGDRWIGKEEETSLMIMKARVLGTKLESNAICQERKKEKNESDKKEEKEEEEKIMKTIQAKMHNSISWAIFTGLAALFLFQAPAQTLW